MRRSACCWRIVIVVGLAISYGLLIYASLEPPAASKASSVHPSEEPIPPTPPTPPPSIETIIASKVSALVKVHKRADIAVRAAFSVYQLYPNMEIIMVDDSPNPINLTLPPTARYFRIPENTGISYGRNFGVNQTRTEYLLILDDDWVVLPQSQLHNAFQLIEANRSLAIVAGLLCMKEPLDGCYGYQGSLGIIDGLLTYRDKEVREHMTNNKGSGSPGSGAGCAIVDLAENVILARTAVLRQYPWDNQLTNAEHEDFYLSMKGHVLVASCSWFKMLHLRPPLDKYDGYVYDRDLNANQDRLCKKWSLRGFNMMYSEWQRPCPSI